jgi:preprotein translocase subunit SecB
MRPAQFLLPDLKDTRPMADEEGVLTNLDNHSDAQPNGVDTQPTIGLITQYVKDLSVENPNAPDVFQWAEPPQLDVQFNIGAEPVGTDVHEVILKMTITATAPRGKAYIVDLAFCGLVGMRNVPEEQAHAFLYAEAPRLLFPFARRVVADAVRDAGFPPLMLDPIDFGGLYVQRLQARRAEEAASGPPIVPVTGNA